MQLWCIIQQSSMLNWNTHIFNHKNPSCNTILKAKKFSRMFQNMKMFQKKCITENKANTKSFTGKYFLCSFPWFLTKKGSLFKFHDNFMIFLIFRLAVNPACSMCILFGFWDSCSNSKVNNTQKSFKIHVNFQRQS